MKRKFEFEFELLLSNCPDDDDEATSNFEGISWPEAPRPWAKKRKRDLDRAGNYVKLQTQAFFDRTEKPFSCKNCAGTSCFMDGSAPTCSACVASSRDICDKLATFATDCVQQCLRAVRVRIRTQTRTRFQAPLPLVMRVRRRSRHEDLKHTDCFVCEVLKVCALAQKFGETKKLDEFLKQRLVKTSQAVADAVPLVELEASELYLRSANATLDVKRLKKKPQRQPQRQPQPQPQPQPERQPQPQPQPAELAKTFVNCLREHLTTARRLVMRRIRGSNHNSTTVPLSVQGMLLNARRSFVAHIQKLMNTGACWSYKVENASECLRPNGGTLKDLADRLLLRDLERRSYGVRLTTAADRYARLNIEDGRPAPDSIGDLNPATHYVLALKGPQIALPSFVRVEDLNAKRNYFFQTFFADKIDSKVKLLNDLQNAVHRIDAYFRLRLE